ncbi:MAG: DNA-binding protein WhiA [Lachnospiraceae bacterium]|nr:DNA-binding protein WhiA [Lachnospiraceae bacterium]
MSFSQDIKEQIARHLPQKRKDRISFLAAMFMQCGHRKEISENCPAVYFVTEREDVARICFTLLKKTYNINIGCSVKYAHTEVFRLKIKGAESLDICRDLCVERDLAGLDLDDAESRRAFISGAFLCSGSCNDPQKSYHLEIVCDTDEKADFLKEQMERFDIKAKTVCRKNHRVIYLKNGSQIVDMLALMDAHVSLMVMENSRILKDMRNSVNRRVNCETANISKTVSAAVKQIEDIRFLEETGRLSELNAGLKDMARIRLENPELPLQELGKFFDPPIGKSGVNHRLRSLCEEAAKYRKVKA